MGNSGFGIDVSPTKIEDFTQSPILNPQSPIPNPQSPINA